ncbi:hypothetical protein C8039_08335 [Halogeometricum sp. wsp3]|nr:hypothetical protein C8039_08335 [Halogeometricum sp. wsp3]
MLTRISIRNCEHRYAPGTPPAGGFGSSTAMTATAGGSLRKSGPAIAGGRSGERPSPTSISRPTESISGVAGE